ncbi:MAG: hypothetical protein COA82_11970 [Alkaliphilus sp.]|nr:flagellar export chaperone FlgN [Alkaliphilus sp. AH-315-G20]PHS30026.1 MAG: hypothetical protein COA82_11970 [Alkaliphilus sp.]
MRDKERVQKLISISKQKLLLLNEIFELTTKQTAVIEKTEENIVNLSELINKKQEIMDKIDVLDVDFVGEYEALKIDLGVVSLENYDVKSDEALKALREVATKISNVMREIKITDDENTKKMSLHINTTKRELKDVKNGMKIAKSYGKKNSEVQSIFIDKRR